jgi:hypothetical protein
VAQAAPKTLVLGAGECRDGVLLGSVADFQTRARGVPGVELVDHEAAVSQVRPQPTRGLDELKRQIEQARSLVYSAEYERALAMMRDVLTGLERTPPREAGLWATTVEALMLVAQIHKNVERIRDSNEAFRRILRVEPQYQADTNIWPSRTIRALEGARRDVRRAKKGVLQVATLAGSGAAVFVDGREVGRVPLRLELPRGTYRLTLVSGDEVSFSREVKVDGEVLVQVDLAFEGSVRAQVPLCLPGEDAAALRLAAAVGADRLVVLRSATQAGGPSYLTGVLYEVARGERVRNAGVRHEQLKDLMLYLFTGEPDISSASPPGLTAAVSPSESAQAVDVTSPTTAFPWRPVGYTAVGVGGAAAIAGAIVFGLAPAIRRDASGNVFQEDADQVPVARAHQVAGVGLLAGGAALAVAGGALLLWAPARDSGVVASVVPAPGGGMVVVGGRY